MYINAELIKTKRVAQSWTQQHLADACGISLRTVQRVERYGNASNETAMALAAVFEIEQSEIVLPDIPVIEIETGQPITTNTQIPRAHLLLTLLLGMVIGAVCMYFFR